MASVVGADGVEGQGLSDYRELLIGCGSTRQRRFQVRGRADWSNLTTLDINPDHQPDIEWDLERLPYEFADADTFDEIQAYDVLEHTGRQGDYRFFFAQFEEFWRILKPGGFLCATVPDLASPWLWGDPSHTRAITQGTLTFLVQPEYEKQVGISKMTDYRRWYRGDFDLAHCQVMGESLLFALQAVKPARLKGEP